MMGNRVWFRSQKKMWGSRIVPVTWEGYAYIFTVFALGGLKLSKAIDDVVFVSPEVDKWLVIGLMVGMLSLALYKTEFYSAQ